MGLPLRMNNLHAPTVPSGPSSHAHSNGRATELDFPQLLIKKDNLEEELKALGSVLDSHGVTMETPLLTRDGFPRADIDVAQIRTTRARIITLRNDYKEHMALVEKHIHQRFASLEDDTVPPPPVFVESATASDAEPAVLQAPFAKVNTVAEGSPADVAGMKPGDEIRSFGYVDSTNHDDLKRVAEVVQGKEGKNVFVRLSRPTATGTQREELRVTLVPRRDWGGRGLLGCHILPLH